MLARAFQSLKCSQSPKFSKCQNFKRLTFSEFSWTQAEPARLDSTPRPTHAPTAPRKGGGGAGLGGPLPANVGRVRRGPRRLPSQRPRACMLPAPNPRAPPCESSLPQGSVAPRSIAGGCRAWPTGGGAFGRRSVRRVRAPYLGQRSISPQSGQPHRGGGSSPRGPDGRIAVGDQGSSTTGPDEPRRRTPR